MKSFHFVSLMLLAPLALLSACDAADDQVQIQTGAIYGIPQPTPSLRAQEGLNAQRSLVNNGYELIMQPDGNLVLYDWKDPWGCDTRTHYRVLWASNTNGKGAFGESAAVLQWDGNFVVSANNGRDANRWPVWASRTNGHPGARLDLQSDGNVVIYEGTRAIWATGTDVNRGGAPRVCPTETHQFP